MSYYTKNVVTLANSLSILHTYFYSQIKLFSSILAILAILNTFLDTAK